MGRGDARPARPGRLVGPGCAPHVAEVRRNELEPAGALRPRRDARDSRGARVLRTLDGEVPAERRWCGRHVERAWSPLLHRQHDPRADSHGVRRRPPGPQGARLAGPDRAPKGRLDVLELQGRARDGTDPRLGEGLSAFAAYPRSKWTASMEGCVE